MDKQSLLAWVMALPDDAQVHPFQVEEVCQGPWVDTFESNIYGGVVESQVLVTTAIRIHFSYGMQADFKRTYEEPEGIFQNVRRIANQRVGK